MTGCMLPHSPGDEVCAHLALTREAQACLHAVHKVREDPSIIPAGEGKCVRVNTKWKCDLGFGGTPTNAQSDLVV